MTPIPQSVVTRAELLSRVHPLQTVAEIIGKSPSQITRMKQRGWKAADYSPKVRPLPKDFSLWSHRLTHAELVVHYKAGNTTISRWLRECPRPSRKGNMLRLEPSGLRKWQVVK